MTVPYDRPMTASEAAAYEAEQAIAHGSAPAGPAGSRGPMRPVHGSADPGLVRVWAAMPEWTEDYEEALWRPDPDAGKCENCGAPNLAEPGRTMVYCPACDWWDNYPDVTAWMERRQAKASAAGRGSAVDVPLAARLEAERAHHVACDQLEGFIENLLRADKRLTEDTRARLRAYLPQIGRARGARDGAELLELLAGQLEAEPIRRRGLVRHFGDLADYVGWLADRGGLEAAGDEEDQDDDDRPELPAVVPGYNAPDPDWRRTLPADAVAYYDRITPPGYAITGVAARGCEKCFDAGRHPARTAAARIDYNGVREWDLCAEHASQMTRTAPAAGIAVRVVRRYDQAASGRLALTSGERR